MIRFRRTKLIDDGYVIEAIDDRVSRGEIHIGSNASVLWIEVQGNMRRTGLGTKLYEQAAKYACQKLGQPLHSDVERSGFAQRFWEKQVKKGRARCISRCNTNRCSRVGTGVTVVGRGGCTKYALTCPAPESLAGVMSRRRK